MNWSLNKANNSTRLRLASVVFPLFTSTSFCIKSTIPQTSGFFQLPLQRIKASVSSLLPTHTLAAPNPLLVTTYHSSTQARRKQNTKATTELSFQSDSFVLSTHKGDWTNPNFQIPTHSFSFSSTFVNMATTQTNVRSTRSSSRIQAKKKAPDVSAKDEPLSKDTTEMVKDDKVSKSTETQMTSKQKRKASTSTHETKSKNGDSHDTKPKKGKKGKKAKANTDGDAATKEANLTEKKKTAPNKKKTTAEKRKTSSSTGEIKSKNGDSHDTKPKGGKKAKASTDGDVGTKEANPTEKKKTAPNKEKTIAAAETKVKKSKVEVDGDVDSNEANPTEKKKSAPEKDAPKTKVQKSKVEAQCLTDGAPLDRLWGDEKAKEKESYTFKIISWNVAGLRALLKKHPDALPNLVKTHDPDILCLQETKLQESHVDDPKLKIKGFLLEEEGYDSYFNCATSKKGYSGTAAFVKRRNKKSDDEPNEKDDTGNNDTPTKTKKKQASITQFIQDSSSDGKNDDEANATKSESISTSTDENLFDTSLFIPKDISYGIGDSKHDTEGRIITLHFPKLFTVSNLYVPNSGQKLERLSYRTQEWDTDLVQYMDQYAGKTELPVIWFGDLNVAHGALDTYNEGAKHLAKSAGTTKEERDSFERQLNYEKSGKDMNNTEASKDDNDAPNNNGRYVDAFRFLHPGKGGHYTYWSQRAGNRIPNKGLRLDYFICSKSLLGEDGKAVLRDSYMIPEQMGSDHCPIVLEIEIKKD